MSCTSVRVWISDAPFFLSAKKGKLAVRNNLLMRTSLSHGCLSSPSSFLDADISDEGDIIFVI